MTNKNISNFKDNVAISLVLSFVLISSILVIKPLSIILGNPSDFVSSPSELFNHYAINMVPYLVILFLISLTIMQFTKFKQYWLSLLFSILILTFLQSSILNWDYGVMDGSIIDWNSYWYRELIDIFLWIAIIAISIVKRKQLQRNIYTYSIGLFIIQIIPVGIEYTQVNKNTNQTNKKEQIYSIDDSKKFVFSKEKNVFVFVLDAVSDSVLAEVLNENHDMAKELDGFIRFDNMLGTGGYTYFSVPAYLTGKPYLNQTIFNEYSVNAFNSEKSILKHLREEKWNTGVYKHGILKKQSINPKLLTEIKKADGSDLVLLDPDVSKLGIYTSVPQSIKRYLYNLFDLGVLWEHKSQTIDKVHDITKRKTDIQPFPPNSNDLKFMNNMLANSSVEYTKPSFKYYHLKGAHSPFVIKKNLDRGNASYKEAVYVSLKIAIRFIHILKELGIYDSSQIYIMADHGSYKITSDEREAKTLFSQYSKRAAAMFMMKDFSRRGVLVKDSTPLSYLDFPSIVKSLADKNPKTKAEVEIKQFAKNKRSFYTFSSVLGNYYPKIIELSVEADVNNTTSWSLTGKNFLPPTAKKKRIFNPYNDVLNLTNRDEFIHYVPNGILNGSGMTRGREINFTLPIQGKNINEDIIIEINMAAILGTNTKTGEKVTSRSFRVEADGYKSDVQILKTQNFQSMRIQYPYKLIKNNHISFKLKLLDVIGGGQFIDLDGKKGWGSSLKLKNLVLKRVSSEQKYINLKKSLSPQDILDQHVLHLQKIEKALRLYLKDNNSFPVSNGWDGVCTKWGKSTPEYIKGLAPKYIDSLPKDPRNSQICGHNYLYKSDGKNYKFIVHGAPKYDLQQIDKKYIDPKRETWAYGIWTDGAKSW